MPSPSNQKYCSFFWKDDPVNDKKVMCTMCNRTRKKPASGKGYSNLMQHLNIQHKTFEEIYAQEKALASA